MSTLPFLLRKMTVISYTNRKVKGLQSNQSKYFKKVQFKLKYEINILLNIMTVLLIIQLLLLLQH